MKYLEYKATSKTNIINLITASLFCAVISFLLGWIYSINIFIPFVYLKALITFGFGITLVYLIQIVSKYFKIIDKNSRLIILIISILIGFYSMWISFVVLVYFNEGFPTFFNYINYWIYPSNIFEAISELNSLGVWEIKNSIVKGNYLTFVWIVEFLVLSIIPILRVLRFPDNPFSDKFNKWYEKKILKEEFEPIYSANVFIKKIKEEGIESILNLATGFSQKHSKISIFYIEGEDKQYLTVDNIYIEVKNNSKKQATKIINSIEISNIEAKKLFAKFDTEKEFYLDY